MSDFHAPFTQHNPWGFVVHGQPLRVGLPFPEGALRDPDRELALLGESDEDLSAQWRVLSRWRDGSVRFVLMDYVQPSLAPRETRRYRLTRRDDDSMPGTPGAPASAAHGISIDDGADGLTVDTGRLRWWFAGPPDQPRFCLASGIEAFGRRWLDRPIDLVVKDVHGQIFRASRGVCERTLEYSGPHRVVVLLTGDLRHQRGQFMSYRLRLQFLAGSSQVLAQVTLRNREPGRQGVDLSRVWLEGELAIDPDRSVRRVLHLNRTLNTVEAVVEIPENVDLVTDASQTSIRNVSSLREDPDDVCYSLRQGSDMARQGACAAALDIHEPGKGGLLLRYALPDPSREEPLGISSEGARFELDLYPESDTPMHLNEGMGKTRPILLHVHDDAIGAHDLFHISNLTPLSGLTAPPGEMYRESRFADLHRTLRPQRNRYPVLESKIDMLLSAPWAYDWPKATGWRDWGDEVGARGRMPEFGIQQFINNEEDYLYCCMIDAWRQGRPVGGALQAQHLMDIDFIDFSTDPARDGAVCPHSSGHTNGETYPSHQWCQGLLYYHLATGDMEALRISRRIGDNLVWWITGPRSDSLTYSGRESAWPLLGLAALYDVTGDEQYREAGMVIIRSFMASVEQHGTLAWEYPPGSGIYSDYMYAMVFNGVWDMYAATGDPAILDLWKTITRPVVDRLENPDHWGYVHFRNWPIKWADLTVLTRWYDLTDDERYVRLGRNGLRLILAGCPQPLNQTQGFIAMGYRHFILFLKLADEFGMIRDDDTTLVW